MTKFFKGIYTAQITPFKNNEIDYISLEKLLKRQVNSNVDGVVIAGSTGEVSTLSDDEYNSLLQFSAKILKGKTQFIAGVSSNNTIAALAKAKIAIEAGVDAIMVVMPYYNKPPQRGIYEYFKIIHDNTNIPIMLYSVPSRTGVDFADSTIIELSKLPRVIGLKDSANDLERPLRLYNNLPEDFSLLSGEDTTCAAFSAHGGVGLVSVISNIYPKICKKIQDDLNRNDFAASLKTQSKLVDLYKSIFVATNPIPIKFAASAMGLCSSEVRSPLCELDDENAKTKIEKRIREIEV
jgi:4-hydroxy-tetrahydrodipicolinate synthase